MSEGVPSDVPQAQLATCRPDVVLLDWASVVTAPRHHAGEYPVSLRIWTLPFPVEQNGSEIRIDREVIFRVFRLDLIYDAVHHGACHLHCEFSEVDVWPLQRQDFADTKSQALCHNHHRAVRFREQFEYREILI